MIEEAVEAFRHLFGAPEQNTRRSRLFSGSDLELIPTLVVFLDVLHELNKEAQTLDHERLADTDALLATLEDEFGRREGGSA